jgi:hypothetical protein
MLPLTRIYIQEKIMFIIAMNQTLGGLVNAKLMPNIPIDKYNSKYKCEAVLDLTKIMVYIHVSRSVTQLC